MYVKVWETKFVRIILKSLFDTITLDKIFNCNKRIKPFYQNLNYNFIFSRGCTSTTEKDLIHECNF